jgi:hypothetical protein
MIDHAPAFAARPPSEQELSPGRGPRRERIAAIRTVPARAQQAVAKADHQANDAANDGADNRRSEVDHLYDGQGGLQT